MGSLWLTKNGDEIIRRILAGVSTLECVHNGSGKAVRVSAVLDRVDCEPLQRMIETSPGNEGVGGLDEPSSNLCEEALQIAIGWVEQITLKLGELVSEHGEEASYCHSPSSFFKSSPGLVSPGASWRALLGRLEGSYQFVVVAAIPAV
jgi:hypothetical protein